MSVKNFDTRQRELLSKEGVRVKNTSSVKILSALKRGTAVALVAFSLLSAFESRAGVTCASVFESLEMEPLEHTVLREQIMAAQADLRQELSPHQVLLRSLKLARLVKQLLVKQGYEADLVRHDGDSQSQNKRWTVVIRSTPKDSLFQKTVQNASEKFDTTFVFDPYVLYRFQSSAFFDFKPGIPRTITIPLEYLASAKTELIPQIVLLHEITHAMISKHLEQGLPSPYYGIAFANHLDGKVTRVPGYEKILGLDEMLTYWRGIQQMRAGFFDAIYKDGGLSLREAIQFDAKALKDMSQSTVRLTQKLRRQLNEDPLLAFFRLDSLVGRMKATIPILDGNGNPIGRLTVWLVDVQPQHSFSEKLTALEKYLETIELQAHLHLKDSEVLLQELADNPKLFTEEQ